MLINENFYNKLKSKNAESLYKKLLNEAVNPWDVLTNTIKNLSINDFKSSRSVIETTINSLKNAGVPLPGNYEKLIEESWKEALEILERKQVYSMEPDEAVTAYREFKADFTNKVNEKVFSGKQKRVTADNMSEPTWATPPPWATSPPVISQVATPSIRTTGRFAVIRESPSQAVEEIIGNSTKFKNLDIDEAAVNNLKRNLISEIDNSIVSAARGEVFTQRKLSTIINNFINNSTRDQQVIEVVRSWLEGYEPYTKFGEYVSLEAKNSASLRADIKAIENANQNTLFSKIKANKKKTIAGMVLLIAGSVYGVILYNRNKFQKQLIDFNGRCKSSNKTFYDQNVDECMAAETLLARSGQGTQEDLNALKEKIREEGNKILAQSAKDKTDDTSGSIQKKPEGTPAQTDNGKTYDVYLITSGKNKERAVKVKEPNTYNYLTDDNKLSKQAEFNASDRYVTKTEETVTIK